MRQVRDRQLVAERMRRHVASADSTPLLIFPEVRRRLRADETLNPNCPPSGIGIARAPSTSHARRHALERNRNGRWGACAEQCQASFYQRSVPDPVISLLYPKP